MMDPTPTPAAEPTYHVSVGGQVEELPASQAKEMLEAGYSIASPAEVKQYQADKDRQEKFGGVGGTLVAGAAGVASGVTLGLSDVALTKTGLVAPETLRGLQEANPYASGIGQVVGTIAPALLTGGTSLVGKGVASAAKLAAPELVGAAGRGIERAILGAGEAGLARRAAAKGLGLAAESAAYEAGALVSQSVLDPDFHAEAALGQGEAAVLLGLGLGAAGGAAGGALSRMLRGKPGGTEGLAGKLADWTRGFEAERNLKAAGAIQSDIAKAEKRVGAEGLREIALEMRDRGLLTPMSTPEQVLERSQALRHEAGGRMGKVLESVDQSAAPGTRPTMQSLVDDAKTKILGPLVANPMPSAQGAARELGGVLDSYASKFGAAEVPLADLHGIRRQVDQEIYGLRGVMDPLANARKTALHDFRGLVDDTIEAGFKRAGGDASAAAWKDANRAYQVARTAEGFAERGIQRAVGNNPFGLTASVLGGPMAAAVTAAHGILGGAGAGAAMAVGTEWIRDHFSSLSGAAARALRDRLATGMAPERALAMGAIETTGHSMLDRAGSAVRGMLSAATPKSVALYASRDRDIDQARTQLAALQDPERAMGALESLAAEVAPHDPGTAQALAVSGGRLVAFLQSKAPHPKAAGPLLPEPQPTPEERSKFGRYLAAATNPAGVLEQIRHGVATPEAMETLRTLYPTIHKQAVAEAIDAIAAKGVERLTFAQRQRMAQLLGQDVDGTLLALPVNAAHWAQAAAAKAAQGQQSRAGGGKMPSRLQTRSQAAQERS